MSTNPGKGKLSGAARRSIKKRKEASESELMQKIPKLSTYFSNPSQKTVDTGASSEDTEEYQNDQTEGEVLKDTDGSITEQLEGSELATDEQDHADTLPETERECENTAENLPKSADRAYFVGKTLKTCEKHFIVQSGLHQPKGPFPKQKDGSSKGRSFSEHFYTRHTKSGLSLPRIWLSYSPIADKCYCTPCWLFSTTPNQAWTEGTNDLKNLPRSIERHENSSAHSEACQVYNTWKNDATVDLLADKQIDENRKYWRLVLDRVVNVIITLSRCNLAFRGHREQVYDEEDKPVPGSRGNFIEFVHLIARYDPVLENLLRKPKSSTKYLSGSIQNEIIDILANHVKQQIVDEIAHAPFVSVIMDTTIDISKADQLSKVFRYVTIEKNNDGIPVSLRINESFVGYTEVKSQKADDLAVVIMEEIEKITELRKLRGQGYDGAANMSGAYGGVQTQLKQKAPKAQYIHCCAHALNLVINDAVKHIQDLRNFFDVLERLYIFFSAISRWNRLQKEGNSSVTLKRLCPTRWSSRNQALLALRTRFVDVMKLLTILSFTGKNGEEKCEATSLKKYFEQFSSVVTVIVLSKILGPLDIISKSLQSQSSDLNTAVVLLQSFVQDMVQLRNNWESTVSLAKEIASSWGIECMFFPSKRIRQVKSFHDDLSRDSRLQSAEKRFQVEVFNALIDITMNQIETRFQAIQQTYQLFMCIQPKIILEKSVEELVELSKVLTNQYSEDISEELADQLVLFKLTLSVKLSDIKSVQELAEFLLIGHPELSSSFSEVITASLLYLTLPITVAKAERSFSKLKLIKTYLRSMMSETRLSSLALLSIENQRLNNVDIEKIIDIFADSKARQKPF